MASRGGGSSLNAIEPGDKLIGAAGGRVALDIGLGRAVHRVEHHEAVLGPPILEGKQINVSCEGPQASSQDAPRPPPRRLKGRTPSLPPW